MSSEIMDSGPVVVVDALAKIYGDFHAVDGVSFSVGKGEIFGILGPNGAGKTTTIECLVGLRTPSAGSVRVLGMDPSADRRAFTERVAVQPQSASLFNTLTVDETLRLFQSFYRRPLDVDQIRAEIRLDAQGATRVKHLSGGQLRRLLLGVALIGGPEVVVLDEPSAGLDPAARHDLWATVKELAAGGTTVLLSTHHMDEATELCDRVAILVHGQIVALDTPEALVMEREADTRVSFHVPLKTDRSLIDELADQADIKAEEDRRGIRVEIRTSDPDALIRKVTFTPGVDASGYNIQRGSLEDLFIELSRDVDV